MLNKIFLFLFSGLVLAVCAGSAEASFAIAYAAPVDPASEGFAPFSGGGPSTVGPIADDQGLPAWSIAGSNLGSQYAYFSGALSASQRSDIANQGFVLTLKARVVQNLAPAYGAGNNTTVASGVLEMDSKRYDIMLGVNGNGDTVVVLPTSHAYGPGNSIDATGPSYTLVGSGSSYHTYQLIYEPNTLLAALFVDGTERISGYAGNSTSANNLGLGFGAFSGGQGNFNFVQLASVPLPAAAWLFGSALAGLGVFVRRRAK